MSNPRGLSRRSLLRAAWLLFMFVALLLGLRLLWPQARALSGVLDVLKGMDWALLAAAAALEALSYAAMGALLVSLTSGPGVRLPLGRAMLVWVASGAVGMAVGGLVGSTAAMARWLIAAGVPRRDAIPANPLSIQMMNLLLLALAVTGLVHLLVARTLELWQIVGFALILGGVVLLLGALLYGQRRPGSLARMVSRPLARVSHWVHRPHDPAQVQARVLDLLEHWDRRLGPGWGRPLGSAAVAIVSDIACVAALFAAAGYPVTPGVLLMGYGLPLLLGRISILPGGVGLVEVTMTALYASLGIPQTILVIVVLVYRLLSFWIPVAVGFAAAPWLNRGGGR